MSLGYSRRQFLKLCGATTVLVAVGNFNFLEKAQAAVPTLRIAGATITPGICAYCSVGCGISVYTDAVTGNVIDIEGDPDHPINRGSLCSKGSSLFQFVNNGNRLTTPLYRAPGTNTWVAKDWNTIMNDIANRVYTTRNSTFVTTDGAGITVNRTDAIANLGGAALDNEECYLLSKAMRALGINYLEHQARL
jgi:formate dehydrogenase major subunit